MSKLVNNLNSGVEIACTVVSSLSRRDRASATTFEVHCELVAKQLADPCVLQNRGESLIKEILQAIVVCPDAKLVRPEIGAPMEDNFDMPN
jgi:hypothetical protein